MLTGELPIGRFAAPSMKAEIDVRLDEVVLRTLEKEPHRRYQHASQIKSDLQSITSTDESALAATMIHGAAAESEKISRASLQQQELAGRLLLTRRQLMERVRNALRPLFRGQILQILVGVALIALGAWCWGPNTHIPQKLVCGVILHVYGVLMIGAAAAVASRIKRIDYSKPISDIRRNLDRVRVVYLRAGPIAGFPWWLMWIPACVAIGFDAVVIHRNSLIPSLVIGVVGLTVSLGLHLRVLNSSESWRKRFAGASIAAADRTLDEIEGAQIR